MKRWLYAIEGFATLTMACAHVPGEVFGKDTPAVTEDARTDLGALPDGGFDVVAEAVAPPVDVPLMQVDTTPTNGLVVADVAMPNDTVSAPPTDVGCSLPPPVARPPMPMPSGESVVRALAAERPDLQIHVWRWAARTVFSSNWYVVVAPSIRAGGSTEGWVHSAATS
jgi:hypothetical protein